MKWKERRRKKRMKELKESWTEFEIKWKKKLNRIFVAKLWRQSSRRRTKVSFIRNEENKSFDFKELKIFNILGKGYGVHC